MIQEAEAQDEAELWAKMARVRYGVTRGTEPTPIIKQLKVSHMETAAVATKSEEFDWMLDMLMDFDREYQTVMDGFDSINTKSN